MNESDKLKEAKYFFSQMVREKNNQKSLKYNLSAFLSASRSVLQYIFADISKRKGGRIWYDAQVTSSSTISCFKDKRNVNIHFSPISVRRDIDIKTSENIDISESISIRLFNSEGDIEGEYTSLLETPKASNNASSSIELRYRFEDWVGSEDVFTLCKEYIKDINSLIDDGKKNGYLI